MKVNIKVGSLVILSGPSGSGKSTVCGQIAKDYHPSLILSSDALREQCYGSRPTCEGESPQPVDDRLIFQIMEEITHSRLREGLTTFIDATMLNDQTRGDFIKIAQKLDCSYQVLIFDVSDEELHQRNRSRKRIVPSAVLEKQIRRHQKASRYPHLTSDYFEITIDPYSISDDIKLDVIGDIHGMTQELDQLLTAMGYQWVEEKLMHSEDPQRRVLFLGDLVDRGYDSIGVLRRVMKAVSSGHYCVLGNHDLNLLRGLQEEKKPRSLSTQKTLHEILTQCDKKEIKIITHFLKRLPPYYIHQHTVYVHADIEWFDPYLTPKQHLIRGFSKLDQPHDTDQVYKTLFERGDNSYQLVRGHIPPTGKRSNLIDSPVSALEAGQALGGELVGLTATGDLATVDCSHYCYSPNHALLEGLKNKNIKNKEEGYLSIYRYNAKVFYHNLWHTSPYLLMARGLVLGLGGEIVQRPFDKIFNYGENKTYPPLDKIITASEKINGFLIAITKHPYQEGLLYTTTGSLSGTHVDMGKEMSKPHYGSLIKYLLNKNQTLLFEVIHPEDSHPIPSENYGIYLIGCREKTSGYCFTEEELDELGNKLEIPRPKHFQASLAEVLKLSNQVEIEGYVIRDQDQYLCKVKTPYYLTLKFLSRLSEKKIKHLFHSPDSFKKECDEEFYEVVDLITQYWTLEDYLGLSELEKRDWLIIKLSRSV
ncbi:AAA family ATPase [Halothece sp. PCC 7418]|uniref:AAA family ATPase n=1 Tax=Halothece sp. (strain PCC 7418) TaxID=65093 RepID=UPI001494730A|nr:AAA family ATPase [Halothece sp. PCC 7418]